MGAYSPAPVLSDAMIAKVMEQVIEPTVKGMALDGLPYTGFLYAGLMIGAEGEPQVLEFNCRFGDPETQPVLMRLDSDLVDLIEAGVDGTLDQVGADWTDKAAVGVVLASAGYPESSSKGDVITGLDALPEGVKAFHAGTAEADGQIVTNGGRVLCITALGETVEAAQRAAYAGVDRVHFEGGFCRRDIGWRAIGR